MARTKKNAKFLNIPAEYADAATARYGVLPVPYEGTVSYKRGTASAPKQILNASQQVELLDEELLQEYYKAGVATYPPIAPAKTPREEMRRVRAAALKIMKSGKFLLTFGGEHSITTALFDAAVEVHGPLSVLQIDAHADLRDSFRGTNLSHGCVMRRLMEKARSLCQVGIRSFSSDELAQCPRQAARFITPQIIAADPDWIDRALSLLGPKVYLTIDVDGFDPSVVSGTGTPEPGGLSWQQGLSLLRRVCTERTVVAADIVEIRPIPPSQVSEFLAARLGYKIIAYTQAKRHVQKA